MQREITRGNVRDLVRKGARGGARQLQDRDAAVQHGPARLQEVPELPPQARLPAAVQGIQVGRRPAKRLRVPGSPLSLPVKTDQTSRHDCAFGQWTCSRTRPNARILYSLKRQVVERRTADRPREGSWFLWCVHGRSDYPRPVVPARVRQTGASRSRPRRASGGAAGPASQAAPPPGQKPRRAAKPGQKPATPPVHAATAAPRRPTTSSGRTMCWQVLFWRRRTSTSDVTVRPDGMISLPMLNDIQAAGPDARAAAQKDHRAGEAVLRDPAVTVIVKHDQQPEGVHHRPGRASPGPIRSPRRRRCCSSSRWPAA